MSERAYTVKELDALRDAVENKFLWGRYNGPHEGQFSTYDHNEMTKTVEERVRTHMLAGHTAEDLLASEK